MKENIDQCIALLGKTIYMPILTGLNSMEVIQIITNKNLFQCSACSSGRIIAHPFESPV